MPPRPVSFIRACLPVVAVVPLVLMFGCGSGSYGSTRGAAVVVAPPTVPPTGSGSGNAGFGGAGSVAGTDNQVIATASSSAVAVMIGASQTISITFASTDGKPMTGFGISGSLGNLPAGWSGPASFSCAAVSTASACVLNLVYAPTAVATGTFTLNYVVINNSAIPGTTGAVTIAYAATAHNNVVASVSPTAQVDAVAGKSAQTVSVNFTTDDGDAATNLMLTTNLTALPAGWTSAAPSFSCAIVSAGNGCQLGLSYSPMAASAGTLTLNYGFTDDAGVAQTGTLNIPYATISPNTVIATAAPSGQITAVQKTGAQAVPVTFTTDDGNPATQLVVTSNLSKLPPGWTSTSTSFSCASVGTGNGCLLPLRYSPTTLGSGTLSLTYTYMDGSGAQNAGLLNIGYTATTNDSVVGTASPAGQINAVVGMGNQAVTVTFATDDARPATALQLITSLAALPAGWSSTGSSLACSGLDAENVCQLSLTYAPSAAGSGTLNLNYTYTNNAGQPKTGTVNIPYRATTNDNIVGTAAPTSLLVRSGSTTPVTIMFATDDGNPASGLTVTSGLAALPAGWSSSSSTLTCAIVSTGSGCALALNYAPSVADSGTLSLGFSYTNDAGLMKTGTVSIGYTAVTPYLYAANIGSSAVTACAIQFDDTIGTCTATGSGFSGPSGIAFGGSNAYVTNTAGNFASRCNLAAGGALTGCTATGGSFAAPTYLGLSATGTFAYVEQSTGLTVCTIAAGDGSLFNCGAAAAAFDPVLGGVVSADGTHLYGVHGTLIDACSVAPNGTVSACAAAAASTPRAVAALALRNNYLYVGASSGSLYTCGINADGTVGACATAAVAGNPTGLAFLGSTAYLSTGASAILTCAVNPDGTLSSCAPHNDAAFNGTAGLALR